MTTVSSTSSSGSTAQASATTKDSVKAQTDRFLKILTTQLQKQNPLDPMKPAEFTGQLTQYSQLEQQIKFNEKLDKLISASSSPAISPLSYLNSTVDYYSSVSPVQDGNARWTYTANGASSVEIRVEDSTGAVVYSGQGDITGGAHSFTLPSTLAAGTPLKMVLVAKNAEGKSVDTTINARAKVTAVNMADGTTLLEASGFFLNGSLVTRVASNS